MSQRRRPTQQELQRRNLVRFSAFVAASALLATGIVLVLGEVRFGGSQRYHALFGNVSGLVEGADVRAAGVEVGKVTGLSLEDDQDVRVTFTVQEGVPLTRRTEARVRYANLTGDRYLELTSPAGGTAARLPVGATIPEQRTTPALDLDLLFNGFRPLTRALDADQVNDLTRSVIAVSQGQGAALDDLLSHVGSLTGDLGSRDALIGDVIDNLTRTLATVQDHKGDLEDLVDGIESLLQGLAKDRARIGTAIASLSTTVSVGAEFLGRLRPHLKALLVAARRMARTFNGNADAVDKYLPLLPDGIRALGRGGAYGSFFNFYLCGARFKTDGPDGQPAFTPFTLAKEDRCQFSTP